MAPKSRMGLLIVLAVAVLSLVAQPAWASSAGKENQLVVQVQVKKLREQERKSKTVINFWNNKGQWALGLRHKSCLGFVGHKRRKVCTYARSSLSFHITRLRQTTRRLQSLTAPRDTGYLPPLKARELGRKMAALEGWRGEQWECLDTLWGRKESGWDVRKSNYQGSGAYGIPQALPGSKMASAGHTWQDSAYVQIKWGLGYIRGRYQTPCGALNYHYGHNSY